MIRIQILRGVRSVKLPVTPSLDELLTMERKVAEAEPRNPKGYAFTVGRNWAVSRVRHSHATNRRLLEDAERAERDAEETRAFEAAKTEAAAIIDRLRASVRESQQKQLDIFWWHVFERRTAAECAMLLPGTNAALRVKLVQRGRALVERHASDALRAYLARRVAPNGGVSEALRP